MSSGWFPSNLAPAAESMRSVQRAASSQWSSCPGFGIPTWQRLWSVFPSLTWNGFKSRAATLNLRSAVHLRARRIDGTINPAAALSPTQVSLSAFFYRWCWQLKKKKEKKTEREREGESEPGREKERRSSPVRAKRSRRERPRRAPDRHICSARTLICTPRAAKPSCHRLWEGKTIILMK